MEKFKYPRTFHIPDSPGATSDDKILEDLSCFRGKSVIITEKMDGENTTMSRDYYHARSLDSNNHPSRNYVKGIWGKIKHLIPEGYRICGENVYAKHSIYYEDLEDYFLVFSIWDESNICLSWDDTILWCQELGLKTVPKESDSFLFDSKLFALYKLGISLNENKEGLVIRNSNEFHYDDFQENVAKYVRKNHVQTDEHWMSQQIIKNKLIINNGKT